MKNVLRCIGIVLFSLGIIWFCLPIQKSAFGIGSVFGISCCVVGIFLLVFYKKIAEKAGWKKACVRFLSFLFAVGVTWCIYLSVLMYSTVFQIPPEGANLIVLGAQVHENGELSLSLSQRINKTYEYLVANPESVCILTGGQGENEPLPEAHAQRKKLIEKGIDTSRIFVEDTSRNTRQNLENASIIIEQEGIDGEFAVVTQEFHMFRALQLGKSIQLNMYALPVKSDPLLYPAYYGRELLSLTKWHIQEWFRIGG